MSVIERFWVAADLLSPPFANQMVLEAPKDVPCDLDPDVWVRAVNAVADAQPGSCLRLKGSLRWSRWESDGPRPVVRFVDGSQWDGNGPEGAPFLQQRLNPYKGPTAEVVVARGNPTRVIVRTHHGAMDGRGTLIFAEDLFACLRGEAPRGATGGHPNDDEVAASMGKKDEIKFPRDTPSPLGKADSDTLESTWHRLSIPGRYKGLLGRVAHAVAELSAPETRNDLRFGVSVDFRRHLPDLRSTANLTGMVKVTMGDILRASDPAQAFQTFVREQIAINAHGGEGPNTKYYYFFPPWLMKAVGEKPIRKNYRNGTFGLSGLLSNLGRMDLEALSGGGFTADKVFFIPPFAPGVPVFLTLTGGTDSFELCVTTTKGLATRGRLPKFLAGIRDHLQRGSAAEASPALPPPPEADKQPPSVRA